PWAEISQRPRRTEPWAEISQRLRRTEPWAEISQRLRRTESWAGNSQRLRRTDPWAEISQRLRRTEPWAEISQRLRRTEPWAEISQRLRRTEPWAEISQRLRRKQPMPLLFAATIFLSALLLFWIQLVIAKMLLPTLGGTPAVWNTCMLFFQVLLLAGYSYVLATTSWLGIRKQTVLHIILLLVSAFYLPFVFARNQGSISEQSNPTLWLFGYLLAAIGLPIFLISTTSPLLQEWFRRTSHASARDPYFLFAVSNGGSVLALLSYPLILEPSLSLSRQNRLWVAGYVVFLVLTLSCALVLWKSS